MKWTAVSDRLFKMGAGLAAAVIAYWLLRQTAFYEFTAREAEGLNILILLLGSIYSVMFAFVIFVIWGQYTDVENLMMRESSSLKELLRFSQYLNPDSSHVIRRAEADYTQQVVRSEWPALGDRRRDQIAEKAFTGLMNAVIRTVPANPSEEVVYARLIDIARKAGAHRNERIAKSLTQIPPTLLRLVTTMALALLLLVFVYPFHHWVAGVLSFVLVALVLFFANLVMVDMDNPFNGVCSISPQPFADLIL